MDSVNAVLENKLHPTILFEDDTLLVLDKPSGLVVHSDGRTEEPSVTEWLRLRDASLENVGGQHTLDSGRYLPRFGMLHRIDRETSGVILVAKSDEAFYFFQRQFLDRTIEKVYRAFVKGVPKEKKGIIDAPIGRSRTDFRQWTCGTDARGTLRKSLTEYVVVKSGKGFSELELSPKTGRTHQLRVHLRSIGTPILCDPRYDRFEGLAFNRLALHAWKISVHYPDGARKTFEAPLPIDFLEAEMLMESQG